MAANLRRGKVMRRGATSPMPIVAELDASMKLSYNLMPALPRS